MTNQGMQHKGYSEMDDQQEASSSESLLEILMSLESEPINFAPQDPPPEIQAFIDIASLKQLQGTLLEVLAAMKDKGWTPGGLLARFLLKMVEDN